MKTYAFRSAERGGVALCMRLNDDLCDAVQSFFAGVLLLRGIIGAVICCSWQISALLGGALPDDDVRISRALDALRFFCSIVYNPDDWVLKYLFPLDHKLHSPLGLNGWTGQDYRVFESKARSDRFGFCNHFAYIYLEELDRLVEKLPQELPEVSVMQDEADVVRIPADEIFWQTVRRFGNWQLQKSSYNPEKYRILDGRGFRRATGQRVKMTEAFDDVCRQLKFPEK